jgi:hypothetical protein
VAQPVARELVEEVLPLALVDPVRWALAEPRLEEIVQVASITGNRGRRIGLWLATTATLDAAFPTPSIHSSPSDPKVGPSSERSRTAGFALSPAPSHVRTSLRSFVTTLHSGFPVVGLRRLPRYDGSHLHRLRSNAAGQVLLCLTKTPGVFVLRNCAVRAFVLPVLAMILGNVRASRIVRWTQTSGHERFVAAGRAGLWTRESGSTKPKPRRGGAS